MKAKEVQQLYSPAYAKGYDAAFLDHPAFQDKTRGELSILEHSFIQMGQPCRWLDVACGTGFFLSQFPTIERAGLDLSPAMLERARSSNPGIELHQGDMRHRRNFTQGSWSVISCMWWAFSYLDSLGQIWRFMRNAAYWLQEDGLLFMPLCSLANFGGYPGYPNRDFSFPLFDNHPGVGGQLTISAFQWSWRERNGTMHRNLIAPHPELVRKKALRLFQSAEILNYGRSWPCIGLIASKSQRDLTAFQALFSPLEFYRADPPAL